MMKNLILIKLKFIVVFVEILKKILLIKICLINVKNLNMILVISPPLNINWIAYLKQEKIKKSFK